MSVTRGVDEAEAVARAISADVGEPGRFDDPRFAEIMRRFNACEFDVPEGEEVDGYLFQFGPVGWLPEPTFVIGIVRQLEIEDGAGDHEGYVQVNLELRYDLDDDLVSLGSASEWWFPGGEVSFDAWLTSVTAHAAVEPPALASIIWVAHPGCSVARALDRLR